MKDLLADVEIKIRMFRKLESIFFLQMSSHQLNLYNEITRLYIVASHFPTFVTKLHFVKIITVI